MIRVLVVARSEIERAGLEALLAERGHVIVGGRLEDSAADVALVLLEPGETFRRLEHSPDAAARAPALVLLGDGLPRGWEMRAARAGARAALPRSASADAIAAAVDAAAAGLVVLPAEALAGTLSTTAAAHAASGPQALTAREAQVLALLAEGLVNKQIAVRLGISRHTVKSHLDALFHKLGVTTRAEAVVVGARAGVILL
ncbi:MAG TPA: helix-turn-helix transcriptional regulator [Gemmatimonadales bacterium]